MVPRLADANALAALVGELVRAVPASYRIASHSLPCSRGGGGPAVGRLGGGRRFRLVDASMGRQTRQDFARQSRFREALQQGGLVPFFQPIVDLIKGRLLGFEALARWRDQDGHDHVRSEFLTVARQISLSGELDRVVISQVLAALAAAVINNSPSRSAWASSSRPEGSPCRGVAAGPLPAHGRPRSAAPQSRHRWACAAARDERPQLLG